MRRNALRVGGGAAAFVLAVVLWATLHRSATDCRTTPAREAAIEKLLRSGDPVTGLTLGSRYRAGDFVCAEVSAPAGVLLSAREPSGEAMVWYADSRGELRNVNLLAEAWTPKLDVAPELAKADVAKVER